jgi:hypothetical protein
MVAKKKTTRSAKSKPAAKPRAAAGNGKASAESVRLPRVAKGKRPQYFSDPAIDKLLWITLTLVEELSVTRDRLDTVERMLEKRKVVKQADIDRYIPDDATEALREQRRNSYIERVMRAVQAELEEVTGKVPASVEETYAIVTS